MSPSRGFRIVFAMAAAGLAIGALFHAWRLITPAAADTSPPWRHAVFVAVDAALAAGFLLRPPWFAGVFALVVAQQLVSHGSAAWRAFQAGSWDPVSLVIVAALPALLAGLLLERRAERHGMPSLRSRS